MKKPAQIRLALVTAPNLKVARQLARAALKARLTACANLVPRIESHYWWRGKVESAGEILIIFKTRTAQVRGLERLILSAHPYDTPEFLVLPVAGGAKRYLDWVSSETGGK